MSTRPKTKKQVTGRVIALLTREEMEFLEKLSIDSLYSTGMRLTKVDIISALVRAAIKLGVKGKGIAGKGELIRHIMQLSGDVAERRAYPRIKTNLDVQFKKVEALDEYAVCQASDIGLGGLKLEFGPHQQVPVVHQVIELKLQDPKDPKSEAVRAIGRVVWIRENANGISFSAGLKLTYIRKADSGKFLGFLKDV